MIQRKLHFSSKHDEAMDGKKSMRLESEKQENEKVSSVTVGLYNENKQARKRATTSKKRRNSHLDYANLRIVSFAQSTMFACEL
jgi:hypothetical protein